MKNALMPASILAAVSIVAACSTSPGDVLQAAGSLQSEITRVCPMSPPADDGGMMEEPPTSVAVAPITFDAVYVVNTLKSAN
jgi:hypothetical protein